MVTKLDRLARSVPHMWEIVQRLQAKGVALRIVTTLDTSPLVMRRTLDFPPRAILSTATW